jgi:molybdate-binding protein
MAKKTVSVCDKCNKNWADASVSIRAAGSNVDLKLVPPATEEEKSIGPFDLCKGCMKDIFKGIKVEKGDNVT